MFLVYVALEADKFFMALDKEPQPNCRNYEYGETKNASLSSPLFRVAHVSASGCL